MKLTKQLQEYFIFLEWFPKQHPRLNRQYWQYITIPVKAESVNVHKPALEQTVYNRLRRIEVDYYKRK